MHGIAPAGKNERRKSKKEEEEDGVREGAAEERERQKHVMTKTMSL
jgi:hypothetical protein